MKTEFPTVFSKSVFTNSQIREADKFNSVGCQPDEQSENLSRPWKGRTAMD